ncbi:MAG: hypothetical protein M1834_002482 [Cirrosporium novae-zelandiae]|nr:MAG: hypothetical protein M1834_002482 [Cirrosporium novae-zelandiae]
MDSNGPKDSRPGCRPLVHGTQLEKGMHSKGLSTSRYGFGLRIGDSCVTTMAIKLKERLGGYEVGVVAAKKTEDMT